jgi:hypothetical protein
VKAPALLFAGGICDLTSRSRPPAVGWCIHLPLRLVAAHREGCAHNARHHDAIRQCYATAEPRRRPSSHSPARAPKPWYCLLWRAPAPRSPQAGANHSHQLRFVGRFLEKSDGSRLEATSFIVAGIATRKNDDRDARKDRILFDLFQDCKSISRWQPKIEDDQVGVSFRAIAMAE